MWALTSALVPTSSTVWFAMLSRKKSTNAPSRTCSRSNVKPSWPMSRLKSCRWCVVPNLGVWTWSMCASRAWTMSRRSPSLSIAAWKPSANAWPMSCDQPVQLKAKKSARTQIVNAKSLLPMLTAMHKKSKARVMRKPLPCSTNLSVAIRSLRSSTAVWTPTRPASTKRAM